MKSASWPLPCLMLYFGASGLLQASSTSTGKESLIRDMAVAAVAGTGGGGGGFCLAMSHSYYANDYSLDCSFWIIYIKKLNLL